MTQIDFYDKQQIDEREIGFPDDASSSTGSIWARLKNAVSRIVNLETADTQNVKKSGSVVTGALEVPTTPPTVDSAVNQSYVESTVSGVNNIVHKSGDESIAGKKTLTSNLTIIKSSPQLILDATDYGVTENLYFNPIFIYDGNNNEVASFQLVKTPTAERFRMILRDLPGTPALGLYYDTVSEKTHAEAPSRGSATLSDYADDEILTKADLIALGVL